MFDYDLLILGAAAGGLEAAIVALQERSRVALLTLGLPLAPETIAHLSTLQQGGVDVIEDSGYFLPHAQGLQTLQRSRLLRSRCSLLALPSQPIVPHLPGLESIPYHTELSEQVGVQGKPEHWLIWGETPESLSYCHQLIEQKQQVTLLLRKPLLFPLFQRIQGYLEGRGVEILTAICCTGVEPKGAGLRLFADQRQWCGDRLLLAFGQQPIDIASHRLNLNLSALHPQLSLPLAVNRFLQSQFVPNLYGCGISLGGIALDSMARYEARIAVFNALYSPQRSPRYDCIPYSLLEVPAVTQVGWTIESARQHWPASALRSLTCSGFWDPPFEPAATQDLGLNSDSGLLQPSFQILLDRKDRILGAQGIGTRSAQAVQVIGLARQRRLTWPQLLRSLPGGEVADLLYALQTSQIAEAPKGAWRESFFNWRRTGYF
ncbi:MAG: hypothetical protein ACO3NK_07445 [Prochlorotrichaceae cyanobacterium]